MKKKRVIQLSVTSFILSAIITTIIIGKQPIPTDPIEKATSTTSTSYKIEATEVDSVAIKKFNKLVAFIKEKGNIISATNNTQCYGYEFIDKNNNIVHIIVNSKDQIVEAINVITFVAGNFLYFDITKDGINSPVPEANQLYKDFIAEVTKKKYKVK